MKPHSDTVHIYGNKGFRTTAYPNLDSEEPRKPKKRSEHKRRIASMKRNHHNREKNLRPVKASLKNYAKYCYNMKKVDGQWQKIE